MHTDVITPGSLPARILEHMRVAGGEFEAGELAEALQVDLAEVRSAFGTLRKHCLVTTRIEEGAPLYRLAATQAGMRIPGSALKPIATTTRKTEPSMTKTPTTTSSPAEIVLAYIEAHPGGCKRDDIMAATKLTVASTKKALNDLSNRSAIKLRGWTKNARWYLTSEKAEDEAPKGRKKATPAPKVKPAKPNLAHYGGATKQPANGRLAFAIDASGTVAIDSLRLPPAEIERLVDFLQRTQHVWKGAQP